MLRALHQFLFLDINPSPPNLPYVMNAPAQLSTAVPDRVRPVAHGAIWLLLRQCFVGHPSRRHIDATKHCSEPATYVTLFQVAFAAKAWQDAAL